MLLQAETTLPSKMDFDVTDPLRDSGWDELISSHPKASVFHTSSWARVLARSYGFDPKYLVRRRNGAIEAVIPVMEVRGALTGRRAVSLPFSDYCDPLTAAGTSLSEVLDGLRRHGKDSGWKSFEVRQRGPLPATLQPSESFLGHVLDLQPNEAALYSRLRGSTQRNIKKASAEGVTVTAEQTDEAMAAFYRLNCLTRREHGLPPQPVSFFRNLIREIRAADSGFVVLAGFKGATIAGCVYMHFGDKAVYKYGASDRRYQNLRANNLVMWEAIRRYAERGARTLCFGRTERDNEGLRQFKSGWGTREEEIGYVKYDFSTGSYVKEESRIKGLHNRFFRNIPTPVSRMIGSVLYKYMA